MADQMDAIKRRIGSLSGPQNDGSDQKPVVDPDTAKSFSQGFNNAYKLGLKPKSQEGN